MTKVRGNETIWRLARWFYDELIDPVIDSHTGNKTLWKNEGQWYKNVLYDKALELYSKTNMASTIGLE